MKSLNNLNVSASHYFLGLFQNIIDRTSKIWALYSDRASILAFFSTAIAIYVGVKQNLHIRKRYLLFYRHLETRFS